MLTPPVNIAARWEGALRARLNRVPLETFLKSHSQPCPTRAADPLIEPLELACLLIVNPVLPHRDDWRALCQLDYFAALGDAMAHISRGLGEAVQEPKLWRVAALRAMGGLLTPLLGIDMAASIAAASLASCGFSWHALPGDGSSWEELTVAAVHSGAPEALTALRSSVGERLRIAAASGAARMATAPQMITISAGPPSNR